MEFKKTLHLFDFDGTLTTKDTLFDFLKFASNPIEYHAVLVFFSPYFLLSILKLVEKAKAKEKFIAYFLKGKSKEKIEKIAEEYAGSIEKILRPQAKVILEELNNNQEVECFIVSASLDIWLNPIAKKLDINLICTQALYEKGIYTGKFATPNCNNEEKKRRILEKVNIEEFSNIISYGDSNGDRSMFSIAKEVHYKPFR